MPSLSSLAVATRPVGAFAVLRSCVGRFVSGAAVATREVGAEGATFVRLGRGILIVYGEVALQDIRKVGFRVWAWGAYS